MSEQHGDSGFFDTLEVNRSWKSETLIEMRVFSEAHAEELGSMRTSGRFPKEIFREMGGKGWVGPITPTHLGGAGFSTGEYCLIAEAVAFYGLVSPQVSIQGQRWLLDWGTPEQQLKYLPGICKGDIIFCECISEPTFGSSFKNMTATAEQSGAGWVINGHKTHVNLGADADVAIVYANAPRGLTAFMVDLDLPGITRQRTDPVGLRLLPTADVIFEDVSVESSSIIGVEGGGLDTFLTTFNLSRLGNASELIGFGRRALKQALDYARTRKVGESVVTDFQGLQWLVADAYCMTSAAASLRNHAANLSSDGLEHSLETTVAKKLAIDASEFIASEVFALVGGHGLYNSAEYFSLLGDIKVLRVAGGSKEILRNYVARTLLKSSTYLGIGD